MVDKTLSAPQRSEGPVRACPGAGRVAESWWPAGCLDPMQPNVISSLPTLSCWVSGGGGEQGLYDTSGHVHKHVCCVWQHLLLILTRAVRNNVSNHFHFAISWSLY